MTNKILYPNDVDLKEYANELNHNAKYGLPGEVYCQSCVISNQRPNSAIEYNHVKGVKKETIFFDDPVFVMLAGFQQRSKAQLIGSSVKQLWICASVSSKDGSFDCICPGSGGKDSFYASHIL